MIFCTADEKWDAVIDEIVEVHNTGRPILVGTVSIENSELLSRKLDRRGIKHNVLNAKHQEREAEIIAQGGRKAAVTIATNMAGRGTDIILGGNPENMAWEELKQTYESRLDVPKAEWDELTRKIAKEEGMETEGKEVAEAGGLHVIGTERHESRRIDLQLRGRSGRQGDPGSSRFFLSLEDDLMRIFAGDWVKNMLQRMGMQKGESIENRFVSKRIEGAQKKVEERNFDIRKNLLEYDEVMDDQRKRVYSYRQRILDGYNCRGSDPGNDRPATRPLDRRVSRPRLPLGANPRTGPAQGYGIDVETAAIRNMDREQLESYLRDEARQQAEDILQEQIEENLPEEVEDKREWNWLALSKMVNRHWGLNTNDSELKKIGRENVFGELNQRVEPRHRQGGLFGPTRSSWKRTIPAEPCAVGCNTSSRSICRPRTWPTSNRSKSTKKSASSVRTALRRKRSHVPRRGGHDELPARTASTAGGEKYNKEKLVGWANDRFHSHLTVDELKGKSLQDIEQILADCSRKYLEGGEAALKLDDYLDRAYGERNGRDPREDVLQDPVALPQLTRWAKSELEAEIDPHELESLTREDARRRVLAEYDKRYRPELCQAERALVLEVLDQSWKDHLYYMDHLRSGIGLVGYAQKDPKVEYKREGRKAFNAMWDRIGQQVTQAIFRLEKQSPEFVGSLWEITATHHAEADPVTHQQSQDKMANLTKKAARRAKRITSWSPSETAKKKSAATTPAPAAAAKSTRNATVRMCKPQGGHRPPKSRERSEQWWAMPTLLPAAES